MTVVVSVLLLFACVLFRRRTMKRNVFFPVILAVFVLCSCNKNIEEFKFKATVVGSSLCSSTTVAYMLEISTPDTIGDTITIGNYRYNNAVMAYRSPRRLYEDEVIYGVAYSTRSFAVLNCMGLVQNGLPEIILLSVDEKPE